MLFGDRGWRNYAIETTVSRQKGRSATIIIYYQNEQNFISIHWGGKSFSLMERKDGKEHQLATYYPWEKNGEAEVILRVYNGTIGAYVNGVVLTNDLPATLSRGAAGFGVWDPYGAQSAIKKLNIEPLNAVPPPFVSTVAVDTSIASSESSDVGTTTVLLPPLTSEASTTAEKIAYEKSRMTSRSLPYLSHGFDDNVWERMWGDLSVTDGVLNIGAHASTTGSEVLLIGSNAWGDYILKTKSDWLKGETFSLISRYQDPDNYMECSYATYGSSVSLVQIQNGRATTLARNYGLQIPYYSPWQNVNLGIKVQGNHIECLINDAWILRFDTDTMPRSGGVGFETWDPMRNHSQIQVKDVLITPL